VLAFSLTPALPLGEGVTLPVFWPDESGERLGKLTSLKQTVAAVSLSQRERDQG
jgi:hypothetical protein